MTLRLRGKFRAGKNSMDTALVEHLRDTTGLIPGYANPQIHLNEAVVNQQWYVKDGDTERTS